MNSKKLRLQIEKPTKCYNDDQFIDNENEAICEKCNKNAKSSKNILTNQIIDVNEKFLIKITKNNSMGSKEVMDLCKILQFTNEWSMEEAMAKLKEIKPNDFPNLFIFVIEVKGQKTDNENSLIIKDFNESSQHLTENRPLILLLTSENKESTKIYYRGESKEKFVEFIFQEANEGIRDFPTFLMTFLNSCYEHFELKIIDSIRHVKNSSLILRFLWTLDLNSKFLGKLIFEITKGGNMEDFLAVLDVPFGDDGRKLNEEAQDVLSNMFDDNQFMPKTPTPYTRITSEEEKMNDISTHVQQSNRFSANLQPYPKFTPTPVHSKQFNPSVLHAAIKNKNQFIVDYLITHCSHLIQELPVDHQIDISTIAFNTRQLNILCDLLEISDFPYPENFKVDSNDEECNERLTAITSKRMELESAIKEADFKKIDEIMNNNKNLKVIYSANNKSLLQQAIEAKKYDVYFHLKSYGAKEIENIENILQENDLKLANKFKLQQRKKNVRNALQNGLKSVNVLRNKSFIHNRKISKEQEIAYHTNIKKWIKSIKSVESGHEFLDVVASCDHLKIIFDFESENVENVSLSGPLSLGSVYAGRKWIFIGAKFAETDKKREQQIKGVLAHELCHYVMNMVYNNNDNPYYANRADIKEIYEDIVKQIDKWSESYQKTIENDDNDRIFEDDGCNGIISSVFTLYGPEDFQAELIVRVIQILVEFHDDEIKCINLQEQYKTLFDFWFKYVIPDIQNYLKQNQEVIDLNGVFGIFNAINQVNYQLVSPIKADVIDQKNIVIIVTNVGDFLLADTYRYLNSKHGFLIDSLNIFMKPYQLDNVRNFNRFNRICFESEESMNIIVDCTSGFGKDLNRVFVRNDFNFILIVENEDQCEKLSNIIKGKSEIYITTHKISYNWNDLDENSKKMLLKKEVKFQDYKDKTTFMDLLSKDVIQKDTKLNLDQEKQILSDFSYVVDDELLKMLTQKNEILIDEEVESEKNFDDLFEFRKFIKKIKNGNSNKMLSMLNENPENSADGSVQNIEDRRKPKLEHKITRDELFNDVKNKPYVLISDIAGTGKSWAVKNISKALRGKYSRKWVTLVDLKQYIENFKPSKSEPDLAAFVSKKVLTPKNKFERKLFKKFYEKGKTIILLDGFDEIAPNCAEYVTKLIKSFKFNGGNQLWIATRDYFEVDLQTNLQLDVSYKLSEFTEENGINLIVYTWILMDLDENLRKSIDLKQYVKGLQIYKDYRKIAEKIVQRVSMTKNRSVGLPQLFKMIADGFKNNINSLNDLKGSKIYEKFANNLYYIWAYKKGIIREDANIRSQKYQLNFIRFHQYSAIVSLFPEMAEILFPNYKEKEWLIEEIIACGVMSKKGDQLYFLHETFREYFATDAIVTAIKNLKIVQKFFFLRFFGWKDQNDLVLDIFVQILTVEKFGVIRMFLNDAIDGCACLNKSQSELQVICEKMYEIENFDEFFIKNLEHLADFVIAVFKTGKYEKVKRVLKSSAWNVITKTEDTSMFKKFQDFLFDFLTVRDLKSFIIDQEVFNAIIRSSHSIKIFEEFLSKSEEKIDREFITKALQMYSKNDWNGNIFYFLCESSDLNTYTVKKFLEILQQFLSTDEIFKLVEKCNKYGQNVFQFCVRSNDKEYFDILWKEIEKIFEFEKFKQLIVQRDSLFCENISHSVILRKEIEIHQSLWELLSKSFTNGNDLKTFILQIGQFENNFIYKLVELNENPDVIKFAFEKLRSNFEDLRDFLSTKSFLKMNLLHAAASKHKNIEIHKFLWELFRNSFSTDREFLSILKENDRFGYNVLHHAVENSSNQVFEFMMKEFEKLGSRDDIQSILQNIGQHKRNILQSAVKSNKCPKLHSNLWNTFRKYFNDEEILAMIKHVNRYDENLLIIAAENNTKEIMDQTWIEIKSVLRTKEEIVKYLEMKEWKASKHIERHFDNWRCKNEIHEWVKSLVNDE